jgi:hypothetical protein
MAGWHPPRARRRWVRARARPRGGCAGTTLVYIEGPHSQPPPPMPRRVPRASAPKPRAAISAAGGRFGAGCWGRAGDRRRAL